MQSRNALREQCRVHSGPECWITGIHKAELDLRAARYGEHDLSTSSDVLAIPPTLGGPK